MKNEATLLEQFPLCEKGDAIDLKMLAELLSVEDDLLPDYVFENGFGMTQSQTVAAIDAMVTVMEQREAGTVVLATDAAATLFAPCVPRLAWLKQLLLAAAANAFVSLLSSVMKRGCMVEPAAVLWLLICSMRQGASLQVKLRTAAAAMMICQTSPSCMVLLPC